LKKKFKLTKSEYELMKILWDKKCPMAKYEILEASINYKWKENYLKKMIHILIDKGAIKAVGKIQVVKNYARLYVPTILEDEYNISQYPIHSVTVVAGLVGGIYAEADEGEKEKLIMELEKIVENLKEREKED
jgi:Penicillinase repressor.